MYMCYNPNKKVEKVVYLRNKIFVSVFCVFILGVMISAPLNAVLTHLEIVKTANVGNVIEVEKVYEEGTFGAPLFNAIEEGKRSVADVYTNYIPFYVNITTAAKSVEYTLNKSFAAYLLEKGNELVVLTPVDPGENEDSSDATTDTVIEVPKYIPQGKAEYIDDDSFYRYYKVAVQLEENGPTEEFYARVPEKSQAELYEKMELQAAKINDFASRMPEVNWYVFPVTCFEDSEVFKDLVPSESKYNIFHSFLDKLDDGIQYDFVKIDSYEDKLTKYYRTDHHWNVYGYTEGYTRIASMFKENYPDIEIRVPEINTFNNEVKMYGSIDLALSDYTMYDIFAAADFSLPKHTSIREDNVSYGGKNTTEQSFFIYKNGGYNTEKSYNHYMQFYRINRELTYPENNTGRNLLIIGDSYCPPLLEPLASHFDKTYVRYVDNNFEMPEYKYEDLINEYGITDVVLVQISSRVYCDYFNDSLLKLN